MNYILLILLSCIIYSNAFASEPLNFDQYVKSALNNSETVKINTSLTAISESKKDQVISAVLPQVKLSGNSSRQNISNSPKLSASSTSAKISVTQPLLGLYKNEALETNADQQVEISKINAKESEFQLKLLLNEGFHSVLNAMEDVISYTELQSIAKKRVKETSIKVKTGRSRAADLYTAQAQLSSIEIQLEQSQMAELNTRTTLSQLSGLSAQTQLSDSITLPRELESIDAYLSSIESLPSIHLLMAQQSNVYAQAEVARSQRIPDLDIFANYYLHREAPVDKVKWDAGLQFTWTIYDGGLVSSKMREISAQSQNSELLLAQKRRIADLKIRQNYEQLKMYLRQIPLQEKSLALSQKGYDLLEKDYKLGLVSIFDLIQLSNTVAESRRQQRHQIINAKAAYLALQLNAGKYL